MIDKENCQDSIEIPLYECFKKVRALQIEKVTQNHKGSLDLFFKNEDYAPVNIEAEFLKNKPVPNNDWYYVTYDDGYRSFSPQKTFEDGYKLIK